MEEREVYNVTKKNLIVNAAPEFDDLFRNSKLDLVSYYSKHSIDQNGQFYQFLRSDKKRSYKEIEKDESDKDKKISAL